MQRIVGGFLMSVLTGLWMIGCHEPSGRSAGQNLQDPTRADSILLTQHPDSVALRLSLSGQYEFAGDPMRAMQLISDGLKRDSLEPRFWNRKASILLSGRDTTGAIGSLLRSLDIAPRQTDILLELGFIYADRKDAAALTVSENILSPSGDPNYRAQAYYLQGIYHANLGNITTALESFDRAIGSSYTFMDAYIEKGILLYEQGKFAESQLVFERALSVDNRLADAYYWHGRCLEATGNGPAALDDYRRALSLDPTIKGAQDGENRLK
jgi:tetratricopeptide (TPR) repeat protein